MSSLLSMLGGADAPEGRVHCRHCLRPFERRRIGVVCRSNKCRNVPDGTGLWGPRFFYAEDHDFWSRRDLLLEAKACPFCDVLKHMESVCPHCRRALGIDQGEDHVLAVIGASASGKSHFLAAVLHELLESDVGRDVWEIDSRNADLDKLREHYLAPLFENLRTLPATPKRVEKELRLPLRNAKDGRRILLVFRDLGGEIFADPEYLARLTFLRYAQGVVLMADPLAFEPPRDNGARWIHNLQPDALQVLRTYRRVLEEQELRAGQEELPLAPEDKFLAVAVTKADLVLPQEDESHSFWQNGDGRADYLQPGYWAKREEQNAEVVEWVKKRLDRRLVREAETFADVSWFFTSSIGYSFPEGKAHLPEKPRPRWVHEPIFALIDRLAASTTARRREGQDDWGL